MKQTENKNYLVTHDGKVWSKRREIFLKPQLSSNGYLVVGLGVKKTKCIHELVALAYLGDRNDGYEVDHIDGDKHNNHVNNLRYLPHRENSSRALSNETGYTGVSWNNHAKKYSARILINGKRKCLGYFKTPEEASQAYQSSLNSINQ